MVVPSRVVVDTNAFFALLITGDLFHQRAVDTYDQMLENRQQLWTTSYVLSECIALLHRRHDFDGVAAFVERFDESVQVFWVDAAVHNEAWRRYAETRGEGMNFVDWTVAVVAEIMNAPIFTFDSDFRNRGFAVVPRSS